MHRGRGTKQGLSEGAGPPSSHRPSGGLGALDSKFTWCGSQVPPREKSDPLGSREEGLLQPRGGWQLPLGNGLCSPAL